ncbi:uncharacterized protein [Typha angustifolia]|uniref:uncharacterized protein n=1 Tax=Typha angustifolia TaxID=59011 RepID=UPI003C2CC1D1
MGLLLLLFTLLLRRHIREEDTPHPLLMVTRAISLRVSLLLHLHLNRMSTTTATATTTAIAVTPASHSYEDVQLLFAAVAYWRNAASKKSYYIWCVAVHRAVQDLESTLVEVIVAICVLPVKINYITCKQINYT